MKLPFHIFALALSLTPYLAYSEETPHFPIAEFHPHPRLKSTFTAGAGKAPDGETYFDNRLGQTFTTSRTGRVTSVEAIVKPYSKENSAPLKIAIHHVENGLPGKEIASSEVVFDQIPEEKVQARSFSAKANFENGPVLWGGREYCLVFSSARPPANYHISGTYESWALYPYGHYIKGKRKGGFESRENGDIFFRITAEPIDLLQTGLITAIVSLIIGLLLGKVSLSRKKKRTNMTLQSGYLSHPDFPCGLHCQK